MSVLGRMFVGTRWKALAFLVFSCGLHQVAAGQAQPSGLECLGHKVREASASLKPFTEPLARARASEEVAALEALSRQLDARTKEKSASALDFYWSARAHEALLEVHLARSQRESAEKELEAALGYTDRALQIDEALAEAHALRANLYGHRIAFSGAFARMFAGMKYGPKIDEDLRRAKESDSSNPAVHLSAGRSAFFKPGMFGGGVEPALAEFQKVTQLAPACGEAWMWSGLAYAKLQRWKEARHAFAEALRLDAANAWAKRELARLGNKGA